MSRGYLVGYLDRERVRACMKRADVSSFMKLSELAHVGSSSLSFWFSKKKKITIQPLVKIVNVLNANPLWLISDDSFEKPAMDDKQDDSDKPVIEYWHTEERTKDGDIDFYYASAERNGIDYDFRYSSNKPDRVEIWGCRDNGKENTFLNHSQYEHVCDVMLKDVPEHAFRTAFNLFLGNDDFRLERKETVVKGGVADGNIA